MSWPTALVALLALVLSVLAYAVGHVQGRIRGVWAGVCVGHFVFQRGYTYVDALDCGDRLYRRLAKMPPEPRRHFLEALRTDEELASST